LIDDGDAHDEFIIVDMSRKEGLRPVINLQKVVEVIDHRSPSFFILKKLN